MALHITRTAALELANDEVRVALSRALARSGRAVLLVPSLAQALDVRRALADPSRQEDGPSLALGVTVTTPRAWVDERWEVWGDGRHIVSDEVRRALMRLTLDEAAGSAGPSEAEGAVQARPCAQAPDDGADAAAPLPTSSGMVESLCGLARDALPRIPCAADGSLDRDAARSLGLTEGELRACAVACSYAQRLHGRGFIERSEAAASLPGMLSDQGVVLPSVVCAGFSSASWSVRRLLAGLAACGEVTAVIGQDGSLASEPAEGFSSQLADEARAAGATVDEEEAASAPAARTDDAAHVDPELSALSAALFRTDAAPVRPTGAVLRLEPSGPLAEAESLAGQVARLRDEGARDIVISTNDVAGLWHDLAPKLAARGVRCRCAVRRRALDVPATRAFLGYARTVARLDALCAGWPESAPSDEGPVPQLGDMGWWPPRELTDFLLSDIAHLDAPRARALDLRWRGNRMLSPQDVLADLQRKGAVSASVAHATELLLRGRVGTAALELGRAIMDPDDPVETAGDRRGDEEAPAPEPRAHDDARHQESLDALALIQNVCRKLGEQGITASDDPKPGATVVSLERLVALLEEVLQSEALMERSAIGPEDASCTVRICTRGEAAGLPPRSADALIACGLTSAGYDLSDQGDAASLLEEKLGLGASPDPLGQARCDFARALAVPRSRVVLERVLHDSDGKQAYPAVVLSECLMAYAPAAGSDAQDAPAVPLAAPSMGEQAVVEELSAAGTAQQEQASEAPAPKGAISDDSRRMIVVPREGEAALPGGRPSLSASQIESYLECPYKWFTLRRLGLGSFDADFSPMQMGSFAHRVLEVSHRNLALGAAQAQGLLPADATAADLEGLPATCIPGSGVTAENLALARGLVSTEFDCHLRHQRQHGTALKDQSLVPHDETERIRLETLRNDLLSVMDFEAGCLEGYEPRYFELRFGSSRPGARHVEYAGADFVGSVDRVDVNAHGVAIVIDYKHKGASQFAREYDVFPDSCPAGRDAFVMPRRVQSLIYAQVIRRMHPDLEVKGAVYLSTRGGSAADHVIAGALDANVADQVMGKAPSPARASRLVCGGPGQIAFDDLLDETEERVAAAIQRMLAGEIPARPCDAKACEWCPVHNCEGRLN